MLNRALSSNRPDARFCPSWSDTRGSRRRSPGSGDRAARGVHFLPRPGAETGKERSRGADLRYLPRVSRKVSPPRRTFPSPSAPPATRTRPATTPGRTRPGPQGRQRGRARLRASATAAPTNCCPPRSQAFRTAVPDTCGMCHSEVVEQYRAQRARPSAGARRHPGAAVHRLPRRTQDHQAHQRSLAGERGAHPRYLRKLPRRCPPDPQVRAALRPPGELRFLLPRPGRQGRVADGGQLRELPRRAQHSAVVRPEVHHQPQEPARRPAASAIRAPARASPSARCTCRRAGRSLPPLRWVREFYLFVIPLTIGLMLLHKGGDWVRKLVRLRFATAPRARPTRAGRPRASVRMLPFERVQHAVLAISFLTLVWTGFALKYPRSVVGAARCC